MSFDRYDLVRDRLLYLFNILNNRTYGVWITPNNMMSIDEIRNREITVFEDSGVDEDFYSTTQLRQFKIRQLLPFLPNFNGHEEIGFNNPASTVVEIYESIQEYICLWTEVMRNAPEFSNPPISELRNLENLAYLIFPIYKQVKPMRDRLKNEEVAEADKLLNREGLAGLSVLFSSNSALGMVKQEELSFISYLDRYENKDVTSNITNPFPELEAKEEYSSNWLFDGD